MNQNDIDTAVQAYKETALWSSTNTDETKMDSRYSVDDISFGSQENMKDDVVAFITGCEEHRPEIFDGIDPGQIGHDFWLTRNHHGAGFWDRGLGERGEWLTAMAKPYGDAMLWDGEDGRVYYQA